MQPTAATQLAKKLWIKTAQDWLFLNAAKEILKGFVELSIDIKTAINTDETYNGILLFVKNRDGLQAALPNIKNWFIVIKKNI